MTAYQLTSRAEDDIFAIWSFIAQDSLGAANRVEAAIHRACGFLATGPLRGHVRQDLTALPVRFWTVLRYPSYVIVYDPATKPLRVLRILHGARNIPQQLNVTE
jgi:plasmid stabilization system protein ParE